MELADCVYTISAASKTNKQKETRPNYLRLSNLIISQPNLATCYSLSVSSLSYFMISFIQKRSLIIHTFSRAKFSISSSAKLTVGAEVSYAAGSARIMGWFSNFFPLSFSCAVIASHLSQQRCAIVAATLLGRRPLRSSSKVTSGTAEWRLPLGHRRWLNESGACVTGGKAPAEISWKGSVGGVGGPRRR